MELLAEFALGYRPDEGQSITPEELHEALTAYVAISEWECVVDRIASEGREAVDGEQLRLMSIVSAQLERCRQKRLTVEVETLGVDRDLLSEWTYDAIAEAYGSDSDVYGDDGYRRTEHLEAAARRKVIARGYEAIVGHPAVAAVIDEGIEHIFELSAQATWVAFQGGGNGEELAMARAHNHLVRGREERAPTTTVQVMRVRGRASSRKSRGRAVRRRGSRRVPSSTGPPGDDPDPDPEPSELAGIDLARWELETTGFGLALGLAADIGLKGAIVGAVAGWLWGRRRLAR